MTIDINSLVKKMFSKEYLKKTILILILVLSFIISLISYLVCKNGKRYTFIFPSADNEQLIVEYRDLAKKTHQGDVNYFIDEILLGSTIERTKMLFAPGTKVLSCFQRGNVLYLNLSADLLYMGDGVINVEDGIKLLEKNIKKNFPKIDSVTVFVDGKLAFEK